MKGCSSSESGIPSASLSLLVFLFAHLYALGGRLPVTEDGSPGSGFA